MKKKTKLKASKKVRDVGYSRACLSQEEAEEYAGKLRSNPKVSHLDIGLVWLVTWRQLETVGKKSS
jgi:hypothetical protein